MLLAHGYRIECLNIFLTHIIHVASGYVHNAHRIGENFYINEADFLLMVNMIPNHHVPADERYAAYESSDDDDEMPELIPVDSPPRVKQTSITSENTSSSKPRTGPRYEWYVDDVVLRMTESEFESSASRERVKAR